MLLVSCVFKQVIASFVLSGAVPDIIIWAADIQSFEGWRGWGRPVQGMYLQLCKIERNPGVVCSTYSSLAVCFTCPKGDTRSPGAAAVLPINPELLQSCPKQYFRSLSYLSFNHSCCLNVPWCYCSVMHGKIKKR